MTDVYIFDDDALEQIVCGDNPSPRLSSVVKKIKNAAGTAIELALLALLSTGVTMCMVGLAIRLAFQ